VLPRVNREFWSVGEVLRAMTEQRLT